MDGLLQLPKEKAVHFFLASASAGICAVRLNRERCGDCTMAERWGYLVARLTSSFHTWWYCLIPNSIYSYHDCEHYISLVHISLGNCPALRALQDD